MDKIALGIAVLALIVGGIALVGGDDTIGGSTRFPNSDLSAATITSNGAFTSTGAATLSSTLAVTGNATFDTTTMFVDASGNEVGIGTTSPSDILHAENSAATSTVVISSGASAVGGRIILEDHDGAGCSEIAILNGTVAAKTVTCPTGI